MVQISYAREMSPKCRLEAARCVEKSTPAFYALLPLDEQQRIEAIASLFDTEGSDLYECRAYTEAKSVIGIQAI